MIKVSAQARLGVQISFEFHSSKNDLNIPKVNSLVRLITNEEDNLKKGLWVMNKDNIGMSNDVLNDPIYFDRCVFMITN